MTASASPSSAPRTVTVHSIASKHKRGKHLTMLTAYDYPTALLVDSSGVDIVLVGDSLGMEELGYSTTIPVSMEEMLHHAKAVRRGITRALVVADLPFMSYQINDDDGVRNAGRFIKEADANAVKLEGGVTAAPLVRRLVSIGIPVMGHIGLTPQSANVLGWKVQGRGEDDAKKITDDAIALQEAGAFAVVLELLPKMLAKHITGELSIPTIGIGSGPFCSGQVLVTSDLIGLRQGNPVLKHVKRYADVGKVITQALGEFRNDVENGTFPGAEQSFD